MRILLWCIASATALNEMLLDPRGFWETHDNDVHNIQQTRIWRVTAKPARTPYLKSLLKKITIIYLQGIRCYGRICQVLCGRHRDEYQRRAVRDGFARMDILVRRLHLIWDSSREMLMPYSKQTFRRAPRCRSCKQILNDWITQSMSKRRHGRASAS